MDHMEEYQHFREPCKQHKFLIDLNLIIKMSISGVIKYKQIISAKLFNI